MAPKKKCTPAVEREIVKLCSQGTSGAAVAAQLGLSFSIVCRVARRHGIRFANSKIDADVERVIVEECKAGAIRRAVADKYEVSPSTVTNILKKHGVTTKIGRAPTCDVDHGAFDQITPESAYWMGFLFADGAIADHGGTPAVVLALSAKDRGHVEKFRSFLKSTHAVTDFVVTANLPNRSNSKARLATRYSVRSKSLVDALRRRGMGAKVDRAPDAELERSIDFWRGCLDGDGTVRIHHDPRRDVDYPHILLCGHMPLLERFQAFLARQGLAANIVDTTSGIFQIRLMGNGALFLIRLLYENAGIALERKLATAREVLKSHA